MASRSPLILAVHRAVLRTRRPRLRRLIGLAYAGLGRASCTYLTGRSDAGAYVRGGFGTEDFVPGLSDVDLAIVFAADGSVPSRAAGRARARWYRLDAAVPAISLLVDWPRVYDETELRELAGASAFTYGLDRPAEAPSGYFGPRTNMDVRRMLERPGLHASTAGWRLLGGSDRRPVEPPRDAQARRVAAWLELVYWWRLIVPFCVDPTMPRAAHLGVKLVSEPARIWLWLAHGERAATRADVLRRALAFMPAEEKPLSRALDLLRALPDAPPPALAELLPVSARLSSRIAELIAAEVAEAGGSEVRLAGDPAELIGALPGARPLGDWRSIVCPDLPDESFVLVEGSPGDPAALAAAATSHATGPYPAVLGGSVIVMPGLTWWRTRLRGIKCPVADPVLFALVEGVGAATFPEVRGWSAGDTAQRAVAEHRARLEADRDDLGVLLSAARAALFHESIGAGDPELCLTAAETVRRLDTAVAEEALERYRELALHGTPPPAAAVSAMRRLVTALPPYR